MAIRRILLPAPGDEWGPLPPHATPSRRVWRRIERLLFAIGIVLLGYYGYVAAEARLYQALENRELDAILASAPPPVTPTAESAEGKADRVRPDSVGEQKGRRRTIFAPGSSIGRIEIPRLGVSTIIRAGADARTLRLAVGHIPGTALPGEDGNIGLAGHRDTFFRVQRTNIVRPQDTWVLNPTDAPTLTLVTCYPFTYVGSAPQRFIVRAVSHRKATGQA